MHKELYLSNSILGNNGHLRHWKTGSDILAEATAITSLNFMQFMHHLWLTDVVHYPLVVSTIHWCCVAFIDVCHTTSHWCFFTIPTIQQHFAYPKLPSVFLHMSAWEHSLGFGPAEWQWGSCTGSDHCLQQLITVMNRAYCGCSACSTFPYI